MPAIRALALRSSVQLILRILDKPFQSSRAREAGADYIFEKDEGHRVGLLVEETEIGDATIERIASSLSEPGRPFDEFILLTASRPDERIREHFAKACAGLPFNSEWLVGSELLPFLGQEADIDPSSRDGVRDIRIAAFVANLKKHRLAESLDLSAVPRARYLSTIVEFGRWNVPEEYKTLIRQFSHSTVRRLLTGDGNLQAKLAIGSNVRHATVVLSDIKNFSKFVKAADPVILNDIMSQYYVRARDLVWTHHGVLDKFIGDAVLAIFNYPMGDGKGQIRATRFARDLIALGQELLPELQNSINDVIETGTRVGISTGRLWALDIGQDDLEVSFVGDVINLAARLESASEPNGALIDNITYSMIRRVDPEFLEGLGLASELLPTAQAKGQLNPLKVWRLPALSQ